MKSDSWTGLAKIQLNWMAKKEKRKEKKTWTILTMSIVCKPEQSVLRSSGIPLSKPHYDIVLHLMGAVKCGCMHALARVSAPSDLPHNDLWPLTSAVNFVLFCHFSTVCPNLWQLTYASSSAQAAENLAAAGLLWRRTLSIMAVTP